MAAALLRRSLAIVGSAAIILTGTSLAGSALAAPPTLTSSPTFTPPNDPTGTSPVKATRPPISVQYNTALNESTSTLTVTDTTASHTVACPQTFSADGTTIKCTPTENLLDTHVIKVSVHAVNAGNSSDTQDNSAQWTVDVPGLKSVSPTDGSVVGSGSTPVKATYDEALDPSSLITITDVNGNSVSGGSLSDSVTPNTCSASKSSPGCTLDTISYTPPALPAGNYVAHIHAIAKGNAASYADTIVNYTVNTVAPSLPPTITVAAYSNPVDGSHWINSGNQAAVPFSGMAPPNVRVKVVIYQPSTQRPPACGVGTCPNDRTANVGVNPCANPDANGLCPWSLTIDTTNTPDSESSLPGMASNPQGPDYRYFATDFTVGGSLKTAETVIGKDTAAPSSPPQQTVSTSIAKSRSTVTLHVSDSTGDSDATTWGYQISVTDAAGTTPPPTVKQAGSAANHPLPDTPIDVTALEDGASGGGGEAACPGSTVAPALNVVVGALDEAGNLSNSNTNPSTGQDKEFRTLMPGATGADPASPDWTQSYVTVNGANLPLPTFLSGRTINTPQSITIHFNELIRANETDDNFPGDCAGQFASDVADTGLALVAHNGFPINGTNSILAGGHDLRFTIGPNVPTEAGSPYSIENIVAVAGSCPDLADPKVGCEQFTTPAGHAVASFTVDNTPPIVTITNPPVPVNGTNYQGTGINGTVSPDATGTVNVLIKSSADNVAHVFQAPITPPSGSNPDATWGIFPLQYAGIPDGTLTITASATDAAGNTTPATPTFFAGCNCTISQPKVTDQLDALNLAAKAGDGTVTLTWVKPLVGGSNNAITGYSLTVADTTKNVTLPAVPLSASSTSDTLNNLTNGDTYKFTLVAHDDQAMSDAGPTAIATATPKFKTTLTAGASPTTIVDGQTMTLSGRLTRNSDGAGLPGVKLTIKERLFTGSVVNGPSVTTGNFGVWSLAFKPEKDVVYYVSFSGDSADQPSAAPGVYTYVKVLIHVTKISAASSSHTSPVTISGFVSPNQAGRHLYLYEHTSKTNIKLGYATMSNTSAYSIRVTLPKGTFYLFFEFFGQNGNLGNFSGTFKVVRT